MVTETVCRRMLLYKWWKSTKSRYHHHRRGHKNSNFSRKLSKDLCSLCLHMHWILTIPKNSGTRLKSSKRSFLRWVIPCCSQKWTVSRINYWFKVLVAVRCVTSDATLNAVVSMSFKWLFRNNSKNSFLQSKQRQTIVWSNGPRAMNESCSDAISDC